MKSTIENLSWTIEWFKKFPGTNFLILKITRKTAVAGNEDSKRLESIYAKNIVIVIITIICLIPSKLKYDKTNDDPPNRTSPDVFDIAAKSLVQNSSPAIFDNFRIWKKLD